MKKLTIIVVLAILVLLIAATSISTAEKGICIAYTPEEDAEFKFITVYPVEIEIKEKDDTFFVGIDHDSEKEPGEGLYLDIEYAELNPRDEYISVNMRDETGKTGTVFAETKIMAISDWGQLQIIIKEPGGKKQTIDANTAVFTLSDKEATEPKKTPGFNAIYAIVGIAIIAYLSKRKN